MAEQDPKAETAENQATETEAVEASETQTTETGGSVEEQIARMEAALKKANTEAAKYRKRAEAHEKAEEERKRAEMTEMEKLKADYEKAQAELKRAQLDNLKNTIAAELGLPPTLAARLQGEDKEAITADAKALLESLPKPKTVIPAANPGGEASKGETDDQRRARIWGRGGEKFFSPTFSQSHGGGVHVVDKEN